MRSGLRGVLAKVAEADALRALRRGKADDDDEPTVDLQARARPSVFTLGAPLS